MTDQGELLRLELEIREVNSMFHGLDFYMNQTYGVGSQESKALFGCFAEWWKLFNHTNRDGMEAKKKVLESMVSLLDEARAIAESLGAPAADLMDEKLKSYDAILASEDREIKEKPTTNRVPFGGIKPH